MAQVTSPIILDSTGQQIHSDLQQIKNVLTTPSAAADISFDNTGTGMQADDVQDAITELKSNLTDLDNRFIRIKATTPSSQGTDTLIVSDDTLFGHYVVIGYSIYLASSQRYYHWVNDTSVNNLQISTSGIYMKLAAAITNAPIYITLMKIDDLS